MPMDTRNVQQTGDMCYLYLPTRWCKKANVNNGSKLGLEYNSDHSLTLHPQIRLESPKTITIHVHEKWLTDLQKLIVAAYISPTDSFKMILDKETNLRSLLTQRNLLTLQLTEIDKNVISCESTVEIKDPRLLLCSLIRKIKNMLLIVKQGDTDNLLPRYEEEIDRNALLIEKSVIASLVNPAATKGPAVQLHFISGLAKEFERMVDRIGDLKKLPLPLINTLREMLSEIVSLIEGEDLESLSYTTVMQYVTKLHSLPDITVKNVKTYHLRLIVQSMHHIFEILIDWSMVREAAKQN